MGRTTLVLTAAIVTISTVVGHAQSRELPSFEVASVRMISGDGGLSQFLQTLTDTRVDITRPLSWVLFTAFGVDYYEFQIDAPGWVNDAWVDIHATLPAGATVAHVPEMLQRLLSERFSLVVRREVRQRDGYELVVAPGGAKMREVEPVDELLKEFPPQFSSTGRQLNDRTVETPAGRVRTVSTPRGFIRITSRTMYERVLVLNGGPIFNATRMTMAELTPYLWETMDAPVVDKTGLDGVYQFTLALPRSAMIQRLVLQTASLRRGANLTGNDAAPEAAAFKALEGLGLRLERRRVPVDFVVVDKISRTPTEN